MWTIIVLFVAFEVKHFLADFPMQAAYMFGKSKDGWDFVAPLLWHVAVHGSLTVLVVLFATKSSLLAIALGLFDALVHFVMDRIKAGKRYLGRFKPLCEHSAPTASKVELRAERFFWWSFGLDQMVHHLTYVVIIACVAGFLGIK